MPNRPRPHEFNHPDSCSFWKRVHPQSEQDPGELDEKSFANIKLQFEREFPDARKLRKNMKFLKRCLFGNNNGGIMEDTPVRVRKFVQMTRCFGPIKATGNTCVFLKQIDKLTSYTREQGCGKISPFAGNLTQDEAEKQLREEDVKVRSYLVRFSEGYADDGGFSLAVKANENEVRHYNILGDPCAAAFESDYHAQLKLIHRRYPDLNGKEESYSDIVHFMQNRFDDVIEDEICCDHVCPGLPFNALFRGYD